MGIHPSAVIHEPAEVNFGNKQSTVRERFLFGKKLSVFVDEAVTRKNHIGCGLAVACSAIDVC